VYSDYVIIYAYPLLQGS